MIILEKLQNHQIYVSSFYLKAIQNQFGSAICGMHSYSTIVVGVDEL